MVIRQSLASFVEASSDQVVALRKLLDNDTTSMRRVLGDTGICLLYIPQLRDPGHPLAPGEDYSTVDFTLNLLQTSRYRLLQPGGGFTQTCLPYAHHMAPKTLDHFITDESTAAQVLQFSAESDSAAATAQHALRLALNLATTSLDASMKRSFGQRWSWDNWHQRMEGQIQHLV